MPSSALRNDQQVKQQPISKSTDATGAGVVMGGSLGKGTGQVLNGHPSLPSNVNGKGKKK